MNDWIKLSLLVILVAGVIILLDKILSFFETNRKATSLYAQIRQENKKQQKYIDQQYPALSEKIAALEAKIQQLKEFNQKSAETYLQYVNEASQTVSAVEDLFSSFCDRIKLLEEIHRHPNNNREQVQEYLNCLITDIQTKQEHLESERAQRTERIKKTRQYLEQGFER